MAPQFTHCFDLALLDVTMPEMDGVTLLGTIKNHSPETECVMITANEVIQTVVECIKKGAYDYLLKPLAPEQLCCAIDRVFEHKRLIEAVKLRANGGGPRAPINREAFSEILTASDEMLLLLRETELHAASEIPILVTGETGCGKELLARAIHRASRRAKGPFVAVNMLALSPGLFESEFFGHARGAFTGAVPICGWRRARGCELCCFTTLHTGFGPRRAPHSQDRRPNSSALCAVVSRSFTPAFGLAQRGRGH